MARYHYQARNAEGHLTEGFVDAEDSVAAQQQLQSEGLTIESIRLSPSNLHRVGRSRQTAEVPVDQLSGKSDAPAESGHELRFPELATHVSTARQHGRYLSDGLTAYSRELPGGPLKSETVRLAEVLGGPHCDAQQLATQPLDSALLPLVDPRIETEGLATLLQGLVETCGATDGVRRRALAVMVYPLIVAFIGLALLVLFSYCVAPTIREVFTDFDTELPSITTFVLSIADFVRRRFWIFSLLTLTAIALVFWVGRVMIRRGTIEIVPWVGRAVQEHRCGRLAARLARLLAAGIAPETAMRLAAIELPHGRVQADALSFAEDLKRHAVSDTDSSYRHLPRVVQHTLTQPIENQARARMFDRLSGVYLAQSLGRLSWMMAAAEPLAIIVVGILVGVGVLSSILPLVGLITNLSF